MRTIRGKNEEKCDYGANIGVKMLSSYRKNLHALVVNIFIFWCRLLLVTHDFCILITKNTTRI